ncbi:GAF domain-containing protein [Sphingomonas lenta]|uniref:histidine kinase n=1 Tax=Sphingomonas lenta TaxID=1141887 RepID=A0A2A2SJ59_9SPHN|nr:GAF domain-containing protein [Sphingomonas lenta]PAX09263.1 histidine kinase [Sphingomonas lenta]
MTDADVQPSAFPADGGEMGALMRTHDWSRSPLGPPDTWPQSLRAGVALMLESKFAMFIAWGPELGFLYNDVYSELMGDKHPDALGRRFDEIWAEIWPDISPIIDKALAGEASYYEDLPLTINRHGRDELTWFTFSYSPLRDDAGAVAGMFCSCHETTGRVLAERRVASEGRRFVEMFEQAPGFMIALSGPEHRVEFVNAAHRRIFGSQDWVGKPIREAFPDVRGQGFFTLLDQVYRTGERYTADAASARFRSPDSDEPTEHFHSFVFEPIRDVRGDVSGILVQGFDVTDAHRAQEALRESEDHYRHAIELDPQTSWTSAPDGQLDRVNRRWFEWTGTTGLGDSWAQGLHLDDRQRTFDVWARSVATGEPYDIEHRVKMLDGTYRWMHSRAFPRRDDQGRIVKWYGSTRDIHDRKVAQDQRRSSEDRERFLLDLSDRLRGAPDPIAAVATSTELLGRQLGVARIAFGEIDMDQRVTRVPRDWTSGPEVTSLAGVVAPFDVADPVLLAEARAGRTAVIDDVDTDERGDPRATAAWRELGVRAMVVVPLIRAGKLRATLNVHAAEPRRWSDAEVELIQAVAERTWDAVERAQAEAALLEETRTLETLNRVGRALAGELDLERLVQMVTDAGVELTGAKFGAYFHNILDETGEQLYLFTLSGAERSDFEKLGRVRATGVFGPTFRNEGVVRSDDILADPRYGQFEPHRGMPKGHLPVRSYLGVPVVSRGGEVLGGLLFGHPEPGRFTERHERLMVGVAAQAAIAIDNARLFQQVQQANETLETRVAERTLELEQAHDALRQSQKMEAVGQLTGGIAHDFNNMLAVVVGSLDLLGRRIGADDPRARRYLEAASDGARRAAQLTQRLLAFARQQPLRPEPIDANKLVAGMSDLLRHSVGPDIQLEADLQPGLWRIHADPNQLENAILNLAVNARDAMPDGGRLTIATRNDGDDQVVITVSDTGVGMPPHVIAKAFDPFFTTKEVGKGTGLGLSQVYGFVQQSGGRIEIGSEPGRGASIEIRLPRYQGVEDGAGAEADAPGLALSAARDVVLVVEDEPAVRQFSTDALTELGYRVLEADGAAAALRQLDAHPDVSLLFTDVVMPEVNGAKLAEEARRRRPDLRVLFTTGYARDAISRDGALDPGVELIGKPFTVEELAAKVRDVLDAPVG